MKKTISLHLTLIVVLIICSCNSSESNKESKISEGELNTSLIGESTNSIPIDLISESRYAYIKEVVESNSSLYIKVDYVDFLTGKKAMEAEWRDKAYFVDGTDTISNITDSYYISNINPKIRTFKMDKSAKIENIIDSDGPHKMYPSKLLNLEQLKKYMDVNTLLYFHIKEDIIKSIDERFLP